MSDDPVRLNNGSDPLRVALLQLPECPAPDLWPRIESRLDARRTRRRRIAGLSLAAAASILFTVLVVQGPDKPGQPPGLDPTSMNGARVEVVYQLQQQSRNLEGTVRELRQRNGAMPGPALLAAVEIEEQIATLDAQMGTTGDLMNQESLWRTRVELLQQLALVRSGALQPVVAASDVVFEL